MRMLLTEDLQDSVKSDKCKYCDHIGGRITFFWNYQPVWRCNTCFLCSILPHRLGRE